MREARGQPMMLEAQMLIDVLEWVGVDVDPRSLRSGWTPMMAAAGKGVAAVVAARLVADGESLLKPRSAEET